MSAIHFDIADREISEAITEKGHVQYLAHRKKINRVKREKALSAPKLEDQSIHDKTNDHYFNDKVVNFTNVSFNYEHIINININCIKVHIVSNKFS